MVAVSVITPVYNAEDLIRDCVSSVTAQTYTDFEHLLVDDCSSDNSREILLYLQNIDARIRLIFSEKNLGPAGARNAAIAEAKGQYLAFLDSDDLWFPKKLEYQLKVIQKESASIVFSSYFKFSESSPEVLRQVDVPREVTYSMLIKSNYIGCSTAIYDTEKVGKIYMPDIRFRQDYGLWLKILKKGHVAIGIPRPLVKYRVRKTSVSSNKLRAAVYHWKVLREVTGISIFRAAYLFLWYVALAIKKR